MAWRDSRASRKRLLLTLSTSVLGIAALIAITSFEANVRIAIQDQAKTLLGADFVISSRQPFSVETEVLMHTLGGRQTREVSFSSMVYFPKNDGTRLAQIRALNGIFPYYGRLETVPADAAQQFQTGPYAIVDNTLMLQFDAQVGDAIKIGAFTFQILGMLKKAPGEAAAVSLAGPRLYISAHYLDQTKLIQMGSRLRYKVYFKLPPTVDPARFREQHLAHFERYRLASETVQERASSIGQTLDNLTQYLNLVGFIALLLGGIGVASGMQTYIKHKLSTVATLRCLGAQIQQIFAVYVIQAACLSVIGVVVGAFLGITIQTILPQIMQDFLPVRIDFFVAWEAIIQGIAVGLGIALLFALLPLLSVRTVSPLHALRISAHDLASDLASTSTDPWRRRLFVVLAVSVLAFAVMQTRHWSHALSFVAALAVAGGLLAATAHGMTRLVLAYFPSGWAFVWRQGLANLYRPQNQTLTLLLSLGLGTFLLLTLYLTQAMLLKKVELSGGGNQPNLILFDIQPDQEADVADLVRSFDLPILETAPIVTMRLSTIKGRDIADIRRDPDAADAEWALQWEYRATYRAELIETESLVAGSWQGHIASAADESLPIPISLEQEIAKTLKVSVGDELVYDVQGVPLTTVVGSIRAVDWQHVRPNFFVVFPTGVLEAAPRFVVFVSRVEESALLAAVQRAVVQQFPNVSAIDLDLILQTFDTLLGKIAFAIRFMAFFSLATGLVVLASAVSAGRYQRLKENVLLRTLGAARSQLKRILFIEYLFLGSFASLAGVLLALLGSWALAYYLFETVFAPDAAAIVGMVFLVVSLTIGIGLLGNRGVYDRSPLEVLRDDV